MERGQIFTLDLLLALIPITLLVGYSALAITQMDVKLQTVLSNYALERITNDAADVLVKSPGDPIDWVNEEVEDRVVGLATYKDNEIIGHVLDLEKINALREEDIAKLVDTSNYYLVIANKTTFWNWGEPPHESVGQLAVAKRAIAIGQNITTDLAPLNFTLPSDTGRRNDTKYFYFPFGAEIGLAELKVTNVTGKKRVKVTVIINNEKPIQLTGLSEGSVEDITDYVKDTVVYGTNEIEVQTTTPQTTIDLQVMIRLILFSASPGNFTLYVWT